MEAKEKWLSLWRDTRSLKKRFLQVLPCSIALCSTLFFFAPVQIYLNNYREFWFLLSTFVSIPFILLSVSLVLCIALGLMLKGKLFDIYITILFSCTVITYLQGNFLNISYGELTGTSINWSQYSSYAIINTCIVTVLFFLPFFVFFFFPAIRKRSIAVISLMIIGMQAAGLIGLFIPYAKENKTDQITEFGWQNVSQFSKEKNLLLVILDATDGQDYYEYTLAHPEQAENLAGFTYYRNVTGISTNTELSMPAVLTGYLNKWREDSIETYLRTAWGKETFFSILKKNDYTIRFLAPPDYFCPQAQKIADNNVIQKLLITDHFAFSKLLYKLVAYTYFPHVFKASFWIDPSEFNFLHESSCYSFDDASTYRHIYMHPAQSRASQKTFTLLHLYGMHPSFTLTSDAQRSDTTTSPLEQGEGVFLIVNTLLQQLKEIDVFDNTAIIIAGDHANHRHLIGSSLSDPIYCPVLLYKPINSKSAYKVSDLPASLADVCPTFLQDASIMEEIQSELAGFPLAELNDHPNRTRFFYRKDLTKPGQTLYEMIIPSGLDASDIRNYKLTGNVFRHDEP